MAIKEVLHTDLAPAAVGPYSQAIAANGVYAKYFPENAPARSCVQVAALPLGAKVEVEVVAVQG